MAIGCPFAHRALIARKLKKLDDVVSVSVVFYHLRQPAGWNFVASEAEDPEGICKPNEYGWTHLSQGMLTDGAAATTVLYRPAG